VSATALPWSIGSINRLFDGWRSRRIVGVAALSLIVEENAVSRTTPLGRRPTRRPHQSLGPGRFRIQVREDLFDAIGILYAGDDPNRPAAYPAAIDVDAEDPFPEGTRRAD
jgi:hypothetical protein